MSQLRVGLAAADITPPLGVAMAGYGARDQPAQTIETPLSAQAVVIEGTGGAVGLVFADLIGVSPPIVAGVRAQVAAETDLSEDAVMLCGSHTHWGPEVRRESYLPPDLQERVLPEYLELLTRTLAGALISAWRGLAPACVGWGVGEAAGISFNRRPVTVEGKVAMNLRLPPAQAAVAAAAGRAMRAQWRKGGYGGPRLSPPLDGLEGVRAGVSDPELPLLKIGTVDGAPLGAVVTFACHPVVGGEDNFYAISPDYPHEARQAFEGVVGAPLMFSLGCAGDQVPAWRGGDSRVRVGRSLGAAAARAWHQVEDCTQEAQVAVVRREVTLALKEIPSVAEAQAALDAREDPAGPGAAFERQTLNLARRYEGKEGIATEMWAARVGEWAAVGLPGEVLTEIGLQIKQRSPFPVTAVISLCNDAVGYISTARAHREGGYEPTWSAPGPQAEEQVVETALEMLGKLRGTTREG